LFWSNIVGLCLLHHLFWSNIVSLTDVLTIISNL
jgi:hypothetical protein